MNNWSRYSLLYIFIFWHGFVWSAAVYKYIDKDGTVTFSNAPHPNSKPIKLPQLSMYSENKAFVGNYSSSDTVPKPSSVKLNSMPVSDPVNKVAPVVQKNRDFSRRKILEQELLQEGKLLLDTQKLLAEAMQKNDTQNTSKYQETLLSHEKNLNAIRMEISRL